MSVVPFRPITKEEAAEILGASIRTIENYVNAGLMPAPVALGRRVYWHPDVFYSWLDGHLKGATSTDKAFNNEGNAVVSRNSAYDGLIPPTKRNCVVRVSGAGETKALKSSNARSNALIEQLNND